MVVTEKLMEEFKDQLKDSSGGNQKIPIHEAFPRWVCYNLLNLDENDTDKATEIGAPGDSGIDIFYIDESEKIIYVGQTKYSDKLNYSLSRQELTDFFGTLDRLRSEDYQGNETFKSKSIEFKDSINSAHDYKIKMIIAVAGQVAPSARNELELWENKKQIVDDDVDLEIFDIDAIENLIKDQQSPPASIQFESDIVIRTTPKSNERSLIGTVRAKEIVKLHNKIGSALFSLNPRESKGSTSINKIIKKTLESENGRMNFWRYNNGITGVCKNFNISESSDNLVQFTNLKIVNGRQTAFALSSQEKHLDDTVQILFRIHETDNDEERLKISEYNNTQNPIKPSDLVSSSDEIRLLSREFERHFGKWFFEYQTGLFNTKPRQYRRSIPKRRRLDKDNTARHFMAFNLQEPYESVKTAAAEIFFGSKFEHIFKNRNPVDLLIPHIFSSQLNITKNELRKNQKYPEHYKILKEKIGINFTLAFIGQSFSQLSKKDAELIKKEIITQFESDDNSKTEKITNAAIKRLKMAIKMQEKTLFDDSKKIRDYLFSDKKLLHVLLSVIEDHESTYGIDDPVLTELKQFFK